MQGTHVLEPAAVQSFYYEAYKVIREVTGIGEGKGPMIVSFFTAIRIIDLILMSFAEHS